MTVLCVHVFYLTSDTCLTRWLRSALEDSLPLPAGDVHTIEQALVRLQSQLGKELHEDLSLTTAILNHNRDVATTLIRCSSLSK